MNAATTKSLVRLHRLLPACDGSLRQAACELRWLTEALVRRRLVRSSTPHSCLSASTSKSAVAFKSITAASDLLARLASPSVVESPHSIERIAQQSLSALEQQRLDRWIDQRTQQHKPLQYILGTESFGGLELRLRPPTLIPRWETEEWTERLASQLLESTCRPQQLQPSRPLRILELCSGSGCISLLLAHRLRMRRAHIVAVDVSIAAVRLARLNQRLLGIGFDTNTKHHTSQSKHNQSVDTASTCSPPVRLEFCHADVFDTDIASRLLKTLASISNTDTHAQPNPDDHPMFDLIVANPPYIAPSDFARLDPSVREWEDHRALLAPDPSGIVFFRRIESLAASLLNPVGTHASAIPRLVFEIDPSQTQAVSGQLGGSLSWSAVEVWKDMAGSDRAIVKYF